MPVSFSKFISSMSAFSLEASRFVSTSLHDMGQLVVGAIIGIFTSALAAIWIENLRRPHLLLITENPPLDHVYPVSHPLGPNARYVRVVLHNKPLLRWFRWMTREAAMQCHGTIHFRYLDGRDVFDTAMEGRWSGSPEPNPSPIIDMNGTQVAAVIDFTRLSPASLLDLYPGEMHTLDIAVRFNDDVECYGWNNETYFSKPFGRNARWRLESGRYIVDVTVRSSGQTLARQFLLINEGSRTDFRLEPRAE